MEKFAVSGLKSFTETHAAVAEPALDGFDPACPVGGPGLTPIDDSADPILLSPHIRNIHFRSIDIEGILNETERLQRDPPFPVNVRVLHRQEWDSILKDIPTEEMRRFIFLQFLASEIGDSTPTLVYFGEQLPRTDIHRQIHKRHPQSTHRSGKHEKVVVAKSPNSDAFFGTDKLNGNRYMLFRKKFLSAHCPMCPQLQCGSFWYPYAVFPSGLPREDDVSLSIAFDEKETRLNLTIDCLLFMPGSGHVCVRAELEPYFPALKSMLLSKPIVENPWSLAQVPPRIRSGGVNTRTSSSKKRKYADITHKCLSSSHRMSLPSHESLPTPYQKSLCDFDEMMDLQLQHDQIWGLHETDHITMWLSEAQEPFCSISEAESVVEPESPVDQEPPAAVVAADVQPQNFEFLQQRAFYEDDAMSVELIKPFPTPRDEPHSDQVTLSDSSSDDDEVSVMDPVPAAAKRTYHDSPPAISSPETPQRIYNTRESNRKRRKLTDYAEEDIEAEEELSDNEFVLSRTPRRSNRSAKKAHGEFVSDRTRRHRSRSIVN